MNTQQLLEYHEKLCGEARALMARKNHDYAGASGETPFSNFEAAENFGICSTEQGFLVRILDKMKRLATLVTAGELKVENESARDSLVDVVNYAVLLSAYIEDTTASESQEFAHLDTTPFLCPNCKVRYEVQGECCSRTHVFMPRGKI